MTHCIWCRQQIIDAMHLKWLFSLKPIEPYLLCTVCKQQLHALSAVTCCKGCGKAFEQAALCEECQQWKKSYPHHFLENEALFQYNELLKEWMKQYKFQGVFHLRMMFAAYLRKQLKKYRHFLIVPIPISDERLKERGYNQVSALLDAAQVNYLPLLKKLTHSERQSTKNKKERLETQQPFCVDLDLIGKVSGAKILVIDDIYTTGRTLHHAYQCLDELGAVKIKTLTLAR